MPIVDGFGSYEVLALVQGMTYRQLDYWCSTGLVTPSKATAKGYGSVRRFTLPDIVSMRVLIQLKGCGFSLQQLRRVKRELSRNRRKVTNPLSAYKLVVVPGLKRADLAAVVTDAEGDHLESMLDSPGQTVARITVPLGPISAEVREQAATILAERRTVEAARKDAKRKADAERIALKRAEIKQREAVV